jgi:hypothetical protein
VTIWKAPVLMMCAKVNLTEKKNPPQPLEPSKVHEVAADGKRHEGSPRASGLFLIRR